MMTLLVVLKFIRKYDININNLFIKVSSTAASVTGTVACLQHKEELSVNDLLYGLMLPSGNDAAIVLAEGVGVLMHMEENNAAQQIKLIKRITVKVKKKQQNQQFQDKEQYLTHEDKIKIFVKEMNKLSAQIGLEKTNFDSVHGLVNKYNISTAKDMGYLGYILMQDEFIRKVVSTKEYTAKIITPIKVDRLQTWENTNKLLEKGYEGIKTGITDNAGPCLASSYRKKKGTTPANIIIVVLNCKDVESRFIETKKLCKWGLNRYYTSNGEFIGNSLAEQNSTISHNNINIKNNNPNKILNQSQNIVQNLNI